MDAMVLDDRPAIRMTLRVSDVSRFEVSQAATGSEGLTLLRELNYGISLIPVDWNIRANSGIDNRSCPPFRPRTLIRIRSSHRGDGEDWNRAAVKTIGSWR